MNQPLNDIDLVERYFDNALTDGETVHLTNRLKTDPELKRLFEQEKLLVNTIRYQAATNNLRFLKDLEKSLGQPAKSHIQKNWYYYAAAACVTVLIVTGILLPTLQRSPQDLYTSYFEPYPNVFEPTLRGSGALLRRHAANKRAEAFQAYEEHNYEKAAQMFAELTAKKQEAGILLLMGNANLALNKPIEAKQNFNDLLNHFDELDIQAKWFLSLCYLKEGQTEQARALLEELGNTEISYAKKAKELLKKVN